MAILKQGTSVNSESVQDFTKTEKTEKKEKKEKKKKTSSVNIEDD
jgi:hypothetical protein